MSGNLALQSLKFATYLFICFNFRTSISAAFLMKAGAASTRVVGPYLN